MQRVTIQSPRAIWQPGDWSLPRTNDLASPSWADNSDYGLHVDDLPGFNRTHLRRLVRVVAAAVIADRHPFEMKDGPIVITR